MLQLTTMIWIISIIIMIINNIVIITDKFPTEYNHQHYYWYSIQSIITGYKHGPRFVWWIDESGISWCLWLVDRSVQVTASRLLQRLKCSGKLINLPTHTHLHTYICLSMRCMVNFNGFHGSYVLPCLGNIEALEWIMKIGLENFTGDYVIVSIGLMLKWSNVRYVVSATFVLCWNFNYTA